MLYRTLPPGLAQRLIGADEDILTPMADKQLSEIKRYPCAKCGGSMHPDMGGPKPYADGQPLPKVMAKCVDCGRVVDPESGIVISTGNVGKIDDPFHLDTSE